MDAIHSPQVVSLTRFACIAKEPTHKVVNRVSLATLALDLRPLVVTQHFLAIEKHEKMKNKIKLLLLLSIFTSVYDTSSTSAHSLDRSECVLDFGTPSTVALYN